MDCRSASASCVSSRSRRPASEKLFVGATAAAAFSTTCARRPSSYALALSYSAASVPRAAGRVSSWPRAVSVGRRVQKRVVASARRRSSTPDPGASNVDHCDPGRDIETLGTPPIDRLLHRRVRTEALAASGSAPICSERWRRRHRRGARRGACSRLCGLVLRRPSWRRSSCCLRQSFDAGRG